MTTEMRCAGCNHRFGRRAKSVILAGTHLLCRQCSTDPRVHAKVFFTCRERHTSLAHAASGAPVTIGRARQIVNGKGNQ